MLPSELEGLPIFLLEAMARGVPVVASDLPPHRELLADGRGLVVEGEDFAQSFLETLALPENRRRAMARACRRYVESHHSWDQVVAQTERVYEKARTRT